MREETKRTHTPSMQNGTYTIKKWENEQEEDSQKFHFHLAGNHRRLRDQTHRRAVASQRRVRIFSISQSMEWHGLLSRDSPMPSNACPNTSTPGTPTIAPCISNGENPDNATPADQTCSSAAPCACARQDQAPGGESEECSTRMTASPPNRRSGTRTQTHSEACAGPGVGSSRYSHHGYR
jgi:hypothetical protein